jgi:hypothetical protein
MRRLLAALAIAATAFGGFALPASAASTAQLNHKVTGPFTGTQTFDFATPGCAPMIHQVFDATYTVGKSRHGTVHIDTCLTPDRSGSTYTYGGTFSLTTPHGATAAGTVTGTTDAVAPTASLHLVLTPQGSVKGFKRVTGDIDVTGTFSQGATIFEGPTSGTLTGDLDRLPKAAA